QTIVVVRWLGRKPRKKELVNWNAKVRVIEQIKELASELKLLRFGEFEELVDCEINSRNARGAETVPPTEARVNGALIHSVRQVAVKILIATEQQGIRLGSVESANDA